LAIGASVRRRELVSDVNLLAEAAALHARLLEQLAMLLLGHALAALLDNRAHGSPFNWYEIRQQPDGQA
jgi:hypothetical protein